MESISLCITKNRKTSGTVSTDMSFSRYTITQLFNKNSRLCIYWKEESQHGLCISTSLCWFKAPVGQEF